jgi:O-antigen ligase
MWSAMLGAVSNPIIGVGFDSFWTSPNAQIFHHSLDLLHWYHSEAINEAHNGYIEVFLNLGWIGICLIAGVLVTGYLRACSALRQYQEIGSLSLAFIMSGAIYSITEAGFRTLSPLWFLVLLAIVSASGVSNGILRREGTKPHREATTKKSSFEIEPIPNVETIHSTNIETVENSVQTEHANPAHAVFHGR